MIMSTACEITMHKHGYFPVTCNFYAPIEVGKNPKRLFLEKEEAQSTGLGVMEALAAWRKQEKAKYPALSTVAADKVLQYLARVADIRPRGHAVVGVHKSTDEMTTAGSVDPLLRLLYITPRNEHNMITIMHEFAHLGSLGDTDHVSVLLDPGGSKTMSLRILGPGWKRTTFAPVRRLNEGWEWDDQNFVRKGFFFDEAMAQLVELRLVLAMQLQDKLDQPVVFRGRDMVFEVPVEYGHNVSGWGALLLDDACPGVVKTLIDGARGRVDYASLKRIIDKRFPGLFHKLYGVRRADGQAVATELILRRLSQKRR